MLLRQYLATFGEAVVYDVWEGFPSPFCFKGVQEFAGDINTVIGHSTITV